MAAWKVERVLFFVVDITHFSIDITVNAIKPSVSS